MSQFPPNRIITEGGDVSVQHSCVPEHHIARKIEDGGVIRKPKGHEIASLVNRLSSAARTYGQTQQLRCRISTLVNDFIDTLSDKK